MTFYGISHTIQPLIMKELFMQTTRDMEISLDKVMNQLEALYEYQADMEPDEWESAREELEGEMIHWEEQIKISYEMTRNALANI